MAGLKLEDTYRGGASDRLPRLSASPISVFKSKLIGRLQVDIGRFLANRLDFVINGENRPNLAIPDILGDGRNVLRAVLHIQEGDTVIALR